jgi:hypothetical protein
MPTQENRSHRVRDFFLYTVIGVAIAASAILLGVHQAKTGHHPSDAWIAFTLNTAFVFGVSLRAMGSWLRKPKLWALAAAFLLIHGTIGGLVVSRFERIPLIWYVPVDAAEIAFFIQAMAWAFAEDEPRKA